MKRWIIALSGLLMAFGVSISAQANTDTQEQLQSAEEVEAFLDHLGLFDQDLAMDEALEYQEQRRRWGNRRPPHRRPPVHRRPPHRRPPYRRPPVRRPPPRYRTVVCYAENYRGHQFSYRAYSPRVAQRGAMDQCYRYSRRCYETGCYYY